MNLEMSSFENSMDKNPLFLINDSTLVMEINGEKVNLDIDQITNVRVIKFRDLTLNVVLLIASISFCLLWVESFFVVDIVPVAISLFLFTFSIFTRRFSCKLLINIRKCAFYEFVISKNNLDEFSFS